MKRTIILICVLILSSCYLQSNQTDICFSKFGLNDLWEVFEYKACWKIDTKKQCIILNDHENDWILLETWKYTEICDYKAKIFKRSALTLPQTIYNLSTSDKSFASEVLETCVNTNISDKNHLCSNQYKINKIEQLQLYTLFKRTYSYSDLTIKNKFWIEIDHSYRFNQNTTLDIIFSWENILDKNFDVNKWLPWEIDVLLIIAQIQPEILINVISANSWIEEPFLYFENSEDKQKYIQLIQLLSSSMDPFSNAFFYKKSIQFLDKHKIWKK